MMPRSNSNQGPHVTFIPLGGANPFGAPPQASTSPMADIPMNADMMPRVLAGAIGGPGVVDDLTAMDMLAQAESRRFEGMMAKHDALVMVLLQRLFAGDDGKTAIVDNFIKALGTDKLMSGARDLLRKCEELVAAAEGGNADGGKRKGVDTQQAHPAKGSSHHHSNKQHDEPRDDGDDPSAHKDKGRQED